MDAQAFQNFTVAFGTVFFTSGTIPSVDAAIAVEDKEVGECTRMDRSGSSYSSRSFYQVVVSSFHE